jgi:purine-nucleoside phosphorylase
LNKKLILDEGIVRPHRRKVDPDVGNDTIMIMIPSDLDYLVREKAPKHITYWNMEFFNLYQVETNSNSCLSLIGPFLGAPQAVMGMEKMISLGAKRIWVMGWCGSLSPELRIGDLFIPTTAVSEEGTSQHYPINDNPETDVELNTLLEQSLLTRGYSLKKGTVWTTDAPYRETPEKVNKYQKKGVLAVEMEMAALMTVSIFRQVKMAALLVVSDELFSLTWNSGFSKPAFKKITKKAGKLLVDLVASLNR